jgi:tripeptide aminopeptidase
MKSPDIRPDVREELVSRFLRYVAIESQSDARATSLPSSPGQQQLAELLARELRDLGAEEVIVDQQALVTAVKRGTRPDAAKIGFIAHLDTADVGLSPSVRPQIFHFDGSDLCINAKQDIWLRAYDHPELKPWIGEDIIIGDGTSVLGADNKAAIATIMTMLSRLEPSSLYGDLYVAFVPDEEIGLRGAKALDLSRFPCDFAYTIDACELGEVMIETFHAASCEITFTGVSAHPMAAADVLINPLLMAIDFIACFDRGDTPEQTSGRQGFFWFKDLAADESSARLACLIRDFDRGRFNERKLRLTEAADRIRRCYPRASLELTVNDNYSNMGEIIGTEGEAVTTLFRALATLGIEPKLVAMRGGTDGAVLSARGVPTPNLFTGAHNFHSCFEFLPIPAFEKSLQVALKICELVASRP